MVVLGFSSCNDDKDQLTDSRITYYPVLTMQGDDFVQVPIGTTYSDAGCKATLHGEDFSSKIITTGINTIDVNKAGLYYITYTAVNPDGYSVSARRTVAVCDPSITTDISGTYTTQAGTHRVYDSKITNYPGCSVKITKAAPGIFYVSDLLAGYYDQKAGYGSNYAMTGYVQLFADNTIKALSGSISGWGDSYNSFSDGKYDPAAGTLSWVLNYSSNSFDFYVFLK